jgi:hypothetical protein
MPLGIGILFSSRWSAEFLEKSGTAIIPKEKQVAKFLILRKIVDKSKTRLFL